MHHIKKEGKKTKGEKEMKKWDLAFHKESDMSIKGVGPFDGGDRREKEKG